jgi:hypothetical protein
MKPESAIASAPAEASEQASSTQLPPDIPELHEFHGFRWRGFGEVDYKVLDQRKAELGTFGFVPGSSGNFYSGDFDLLLTATITDKASVLSEIVFGEEDAQTYGVDLERVLLKYDYNDHLKTSFGRYHTGIGYYNTAFHSGSWLQTTADRPLIMEYAVDGGVLPTQAVGFSITGYIPSGKLGLNYVAEYGSSDTIRPHLTRSGVAVDENNGNHVNVGLFLRPDALRGLQIGGSYYHDMISDFARGLSVRLGQTIVNTHVVYVGHGGGGAERRIPDTSLLYRPPNYLQHAGVLYAIVKAFRPGAPLHSLSVHKCEPEQHLRRCPAAAWPVFWRAV